MEKPFYVMIVALFVGCAAQDRGGAPAWDLRTEEDARPSCLLSERAHDPDGDGWYQSRQEYTYDERELLIEVLHTCRERSAGDCAQPPWRDRYEYNGSDQLVTKKTGIFEEDRPSRQWNYRYDARGEVAWESFRSFRDEAYLELEHERRYDDRDRLVLHETFRVDSFQGGDGGASLVWSEATAYEDDPKVITVASDRDGDGVPNSVDRRTYTERDGGGELVSQRITSGDGSLVATSVSVYDAEGRFVRGETLEPDGRLRERSAWSYDEGGRLTMKEIFLSGAGPGASITWTYGYDERGNLTQEEKSAGGSVEAWRNSYVCATK